ncbi:TPA: hypothetical protein N0F65_000626 [Lagenidium giganteum]|uniref:C2H2-type domain-containing protein n=1 Tax=Lagenidium giganteum TaxID=4803 RepID=A0AAV2YQR5_9STRA|nr:TPA: hypothetical protein N0F65_000626 [Lagenidium giganteum]
MKSTKTLCRVKDYPGVSVEQVNEYVKELGPLVHPVVGEQPGFFVDEGRFIPFRMVVPGRGMIGLEIRTALKEWAKWSGHGGRRYRSGNRLVRRLSNESWRDLDGGAVLPGFTLFCEDLDAVVDQESGSSSEEEVDLVCPYSECTARLPTAGAFATHAGWHRATSARARRRANCARRE